MSELEAAVESLLKQRVRDLGGTTYKFIPVSKGLPDRVVLLPGGRVEFIELKRSPSHHPSPAQSAIHRQMRSLGACVQVLRSRTEVEDWATRERRYQPRTGDPE